LVSLWIPRSDCPERPSPLAVSPTGPAPRYERIQLQSRALPCGGWPFRLYVPVLQPRDPSFCGPSCGLPSETTIPQCAAVCKPIYNAVCGLRFRVKRPFLCGGVFGIAHTAHTMPPEIRFPWEDEFLVSASPVKHAASVPHFCRSRRLIVPSAFVPFAL